MKNNKGMTLVEIIISIALISIVLLFLFSLLINVKDINEESEVNSSYLIMKALIIKNIEDDLDKISSDLSITPCNVENGSGIQELYSSWKNDSTNPSNNNWLCIKLSYKEDANGDAIDHLLGIYYYEQKDSYVISYINENGTKTTRLLDDFKPSIIKYKDDSNNPKTGLGVNFKSNSEFLNINIPLVGSDNKDYSLNIPYYDTFNILPGTYYYNP